MLRECGSSTPQTKFLLEFVEDLGAHKRGVPATFWDEETRKFRFDICPTAGDDRDFLVRDKVFKENHQHALDMGEDPSPFEDANGNVMSGYLYCNAGVAIQGICEDEFFVSSFSR